MTSDKAVINNKLCLKSMNDSLQIFRPIPCLCNKVDDLKRVRKRSLHFSGLRKRRGLCKEDLKKGCSVLSHRTFCLESSRQISIDAAFYITHHSIIQFHKMTSFSTKTAFLKCFELLLFEHCDVWCSLFATRLLQHPKGIQPSNKEGDHYFAKKGGSGLQFPLKGKGAFVTQFAIYIKTTQQGNYPSNFISWELFYSLRIKAISRTVKTFHTLISLEISSSILQ